MAENENARGAGGNSAHGRDCLPGRAGTSEISETRQSANRWRVYPATGQPLTIAAPGRLGWALTVLGQAGHRGVTTAELPPGLRWSAYVHKLRRLGVQIWTTREPNCGPLGGHHARYRMGCTVEREGVE